MKRFSLHYILLAVLISLVVALFPSCSTTLLPETGIVTITVEVEPMLIELDAGQPETSYYIYMDDIYQGMLTGSGVLTLEDIATGIHTFEASNIMMVGISSERQSSLNSIGALTGKNAYICDGSMVYEVKTGINYVTIPVTCYMDGIMINGGVK